jgi:hypothetical protein
VPGAARHTGFSVVFPNENPQNTGLLTEKKQLFREK